MRKKAKYVLIPFVTLSIVALVSSVLGFSEINLYVFAGDIGLLATAVLFAQEIKILGTKMIKNYFALNHH